MKININQEVIKNVSNLVPLMIEKDPEIPDFIDHFDSIWMKGPEIPEFIDPFDSIWLKLLTSAVYIIELMASAITFGFVVIETRGDLGHYRTCINQLLSYLYGSVSF